MKKLTVVVLLVAIVILNIINYYSIITVFASASLIFSTCLLDIQEHQQIWKGIKIYSLSGLYISILLFINRYIEINDLIGWVLLIPGVLVLLIGVIYSLNGLYKIVKK